MTRKILLSTLALLWVSIPAATASTVSGTVTNAANGAALKSMVVGAYDTILRGSATTASAGPFPLTLPSGSFRLLAYDPQGIFATAFAGNADSFDTTQPTNTGSPVTVNFRMQTGGTISGTINVVNGSPFAATVAAYNLSGTRRGFVQANGSGVYSILVPPGQYKIVAYDNNGAYAPRFYPDVYGFDPATAIAVSAGTLIFEKNIDLQVAGHLIGSIVDSGSGMGLAGKIAYAYASNGVNVAQTTADSSGNFTMNLAPGTYRLVGSDQNDVYATGFLGDSESFDRSTPVSVAASQTIAGLQIPLHRGGFVSGHATSGGAPLPNITVAAYNADGSQRTTTQTDSSGAYTLVLPPGDFRAAAYDMQLVYATQFYPAKDAFGEANDITVVPSTTITPIDFTLIRAGKISGTVTEAGTGQPAAGVAISAYDTLDNLAGTATSDTTGAYALALAPGSYKVVAYDSALRYATAYGGGALNYQTANAYTLSSNQVQSLNFVMSRGVPVAGSVADYQGPALSGIEIGALAAARKRGSPALSSPGPFALVLLPGSYKFTASDPAGHYSHLYYSGAYTLATAATVVVQAGAPPPAIAFVMGTSSRHRAVSH